MQLLLAGGFVFVGWFVLVVFQFVFGDVFEQGYDFVYIGDVVGDLCCMLVFMLGYVVQYVDDVVFGGDFEGVGVQCFVVYQVGQDFVGDECIVGV